MRRRPKNSIHRREFIRLASCAVGSFALLGATACSPTESTGADAGLDCSEIPADACLPTLGGAPDSREGQVVAAFVDTIIPGAHRDPMNVPGGIDVGAPGMFFDPDLPAFELVGLLVLYLNGLARSNYEGREFDKLDYLEREDVVQKSVDGFESMEFAITLAKLAYYSSAGAAEILGYPGANPGYYNDPDVSFRLPLATEITGDGNFS